MLKGISPYLSPELLKTLCEMGHGDELLLADAHFPGHTLGRRVVRADGLNISQLLDAILPLFELEKARRCAGDDAAGWRRSDERGGGGGLSSGGAQTCRAHCSCGARCERGFL